MVNQMKKFDKLDIKNHHGICSDCKRCFDMQFYYEWKNSCMIWQNIEKNNNVE